MFFYEEVFTELGKSKVRYVVAGGVALVLHGVVRLTGDLDLLVELSASNLKRFASVMDRLGYQPKVPVKIADFISVETREKWIKEKGMRVFSFFHPKKKAELIDVFVEEPIPFDEVDKEKKEVEVQGITIPIISVRHLKALKQMAGRPQDLADIHALEELEKIGGEDREG